MGDHQPQQKSHKRTRLKYDRSKINEAINFVKDNSLSVRAASRLYHIPRATLQDRLHGRVEEDKLSIGRETVLNQVEEQALVNWLINLAKCGFPRKRTDLINTVEKIIADDGRPNTFKNGRPGVKWYNGFINRHPCLSERAPEAIGTARAVVTEEYLRKWFRELETYLREIDMLEVLEDPKRIFNGDETSFSICPKSGKVIGPKGWKNIYELKKGNEKETITVLLVVSASGETLPPLVIFPYIKRPPKDITDSAPSSWFIGVSDSGWMKAGLFFEYIANGFNDWLESNRICKPVLLFVDGHKSHLTKDLSQFCQNNGIILYALPPNTTHIMQPADVSVFRPLKLQWKRTVKEWQECSNNYSKKLTKITFCPLLEDALKGVTAQTIVNGFRRCGLYPFNADDVDYTKCIKNTIERLNDLDITEITENTGISDEELATTIKVINLCKTELSDSGIDPNLLEKNLRDKKDGLNTGQTRKRKHPGINDTNQIMKKKKSLNTFDPVDNVISENSSKVELFIVNDDGTLVTANRNWSPIPNLETINVLPAIPHLKNTDAFDEPVLVLPLESGSPLMKLNAPNRSSSPDIPAEVICVTADIHSKPVDKKFSEKPQNLTVRTLRHSNIITPAIEDAIYIEAQLDANNINKDHRSIERKNEHLMNENVNLAPTNIPPLGSHNCQCCIGKCKFEISTPRGESMISISSNLLDNIDVASDFDFSLPASPSLSVRSDSKNSPSTQIFTGSSPTVKHLRSKPSTPTSRNTVSPAFKNHLFAPKSLNFSHKRKLKGEPMPLAISSEKWRQFTKEKDDEKENKVKQREERKQKMEQKKMENARKKLEKSKEKTKRKKKVTRKSIQIEQRSSDDEELPVVILVPPVREDIVKEKILCAACEEELVSDVEEDELKNIGCDICPKWFHLGCTTERGRAYNDVAKEDFTCHHCRIHM